MSDTSEFIEVGRALTPDEVVEIMRRTEQGETSGIFSATLCLRDERRKTEPDGGLGYENTGSFVGRSAMRLGLLSLLQHLASRTPPFHLISLHIRRRSIS